MDPHPLLVEAASKLTPGRALDLACGTGRNALWLAQHGWDVTAVDASPTAIETLRHGLERHFLIFDVNDRLVGMLEEEDIVKAMRKPDVTTEISRYAHQAEVVQVEDSLVKVSYLIRQKGYGIVGVADESGALLGVIDEAGLVHFVRMEEGR